MAIVPTLLFCSLLHVSVATFNPTFLKPPTDIQDLNFDQPEDKEERVVLEGIDPLSALRMPAPYALIPTYYRIQIRPLFDPAEEEAIRFTVPGSVRILVDCVSPTKNIKLNAKLIDIKAEATTVTLKGQSIKSIDIESQDSSEDGLYRIKTQTPLEFGFTYEIYLEYNARVFRDRLNGLYLSNYTNPTTNETEYLVVTHFEPQKARQLFPGFDEPDLKSTFELSIGRRAGYNTLANMEIRESVPILGLENWYWDNFHPSVKMSTYLVAIVISKFQSETANSNLFGGKSVKVWAAPHYISKGGGGYGAQTAAKILAHYESYFGVKYPLPKMDSVAIPHFDAGAMENYGLNTYREKYLLYFEGETTESERSSVCSVIGHELAHQWFGDLVTCKWWSQIWLNEGFAAFVQQIGAEAACPEFDLWSIFQAQTMQTAMQYDQSSKTHPLVNDSDTSTASFSKITYNKGASLLRMLRDFLGESTFVQGLQNYLKKLSFGNAHQDDLFAALEEQASIDGTAGSRGTPPAVSQLMQSWTLKKGYPLVRVNIVDAGSITLTQETFEKPKYMRNSRNDIDDGWWVPVKIQTRLNSPIKFWIPAETSTIEQNDIDTTDWFVVNSDGVGYYRVLYDTAILTRIIYQLNDDPNQISPSGRSQLLDDYFTFACLNYVNVKSTMELTTYLHKETSYNVWITVYTNLRRTMVLLSNTPAQQSLRAYFLPKLNAALKFVGVEQPPNEKGIKVNFRAFLLSWACAFGDADCEAYAQKLFRAWMDNPTATNLIPVDIQSTVYCTAVRLDSDNSVWTFVQRKYAEETGRQKSLLLTSLACSSNKTNTEKILKELSDSETLLATGDVVSFIRKLVTVPLGREILLDLIQKRLTANNTALDTKTTFYKMGEVEILKLVSSYLHGQNEYEQVQRMLTPGGTLSGDSIRFILNLIDDNRTWMSKFYIPIKSWTEDQISPSPRRQFGQKST